MWNNNLPLVWYQVMAKKPQSDKKLLHLPNSGEVFGTFYTLPSFLFFGTCEIQTHNHLGLLTSSKKHSTTWPLHWQDLREIMGIYGYGIASQVTSDPFEIIVVCYTWAPTGSDLHGYGYTCGFCAGLAMGTSMGMVLLTRQKPIPMYPYPL